MSNFSNQKTEFEKFANFSNYFRSNWTNFELKIIEFFEFFCLFKSIESNKFRTNSNLTPPLKPTYDHPCSLFGHIKSTARYNINITIYWKYGWTSYIAYPDYGKSCAIKNIDTICHFQIEIIFNFQVHYRGSTVLNLVSG